MLRSWLKMSGRTQICAENERSCGPDRIQRPEAKLENQCTHSQMNRSQGTQVRH